MIKNENIFEAKELTNLMYCIDAYKWRPSFSGNTL